MNSTARQRVPSCRYVTVFLNFLLLEAVRHGYLTEDLALQNHQRLTELKMQVLGDRVSRRPAWKIARRAGRGLGDAEYLAVTELQAALDRLVSSGDVLRPQRARYVAALSTEPERPKVPGGVSNRPVCVMLTVLSAALTTAMKRGLVARNAAQLVDRRAIKHREMSTRTRQQVEQFREHVRSDRLCVLVANARGLATL
jgi:hypothetical protein